MFESLNKIMYAGLGAISMSREKAEKIFDEYVQQGQLEKDKKSGFVNEMMNSAEKTKKELEELVSEQVRNVIEKTDLATKDDVKRLETKIDLLIQQLQQPRSQE